MESLIDQIVSSSWLFLVVLIVVLNLAGFFFFYKPFRNKLIPKIIGGSLAAFILFALVYFSLGEYGYAEDFIDMQSNGSELCLMERHETGDGDGGTYTVYRIYVLDLKTGKRILRMTSAYSEILGVTDGVVIFEPKRAVKFDLHTGDEIEEWSAEKGFEKFPELKSGINYLSRESKVIAGKQKGFLTMTAMDGHSFYFDIQEEKLYPGRVPRFADEYKDDYKFNFQSKTGEIKQLVMRAGYNEEHLYDGEFLDPEILVRSDTAKFLIVRHYTSLDKQNAIITAISFDLKKIWEVEQKDFSESDSKQENPVFGTHVYLNNKLLVSFGGNVVCLDALTGKTLWRSVQ